jgi:uncharacterized membrane protein YgcG
MACRLPSFCVIAICFDSVDSSYGLLLVVVIVYAVVNNHPGLQICALSDTSKLSSAAILSRVYKCIVAGMAFVLGTAFLIYGTRALVIFSGFQLVDKARLRNLLLLTITSTLGLILQCVLLLLTTFANVLSTLPALILVLCFELIPAAALLFALRDPSRETGKVLWCFDAPPGGWSTGMTTTTASGGSATGTGSSTSGGGYQSGSSRTSARGSMRSGTTSASLTHETEL